MGLVCINVFQMEVHVDVKHLTYAKMNTKEIIKQMITAPVKKRIIKQLLLLTKAVAMPVPIIPHLINTSRGWTLTAYNGTCNCQQLLWQK